MPFVDTDVFVALLKTDDLYREHALRVLEMPQLYTSSLVLIELALVTKREISDILSLDLPDAVRFKGKVISFSPEQFGLSVELRRIHNLGIFDAAHAACAMLHDKTIISSDKAFDRIAALKRIPL